MATTIQDGDDDCGCRCCGGGGPCCLFTPSGKVCLSAELLGPAFDAGSGHEVNISQVPVSASTGLGATPRVSVSFYGSFTACGKPVCYVFQISFGFICVEGGIAAVILKPPSGGRELADCISFGFTTTGVEDGVQSPTIPCGGTGSNSYTFAIPLVPDFNDPDHPITCDLGTLSVRLSVAYDPDACAVPAAPTIPYGGPGGGPSVFNPAVVGPTDCDCSTAGAFNCTGGLCVEVGVGGTWPSLEDCLAACATPPCDHTPCGLGGIDGDNPDNVVTPCCSKTGIGVGVGRSIQASFLPLLPGCACLAGVSFGLAWSPGFGGWYGAAPACGEFVSLFLYCTDAGYRLKGFLHGVQAFDVTATPSLDDSDCDPLRITVLTGPFTFTDGSSCSLSINLSDAGGGA